MAAVSGRFTYVAFQIDAAGAHKYIKVNPNLGIDERTLLPPPLYTSPVALYEAFHIWLDTANKGPHRLQTRFFSNGTARVQAQTRLKKNTVDTLSRISSTMDSNVNYTNESVSSPFPGLQPRCFSADLFTGGNVGALVLEVCH